MVKELMDHLPESSESALVRLDSGGQNFSGAVLVKRRAD